MDWVYWDREAYRTGSWEVETLCRCLIVGQRHSWTGLGGTERLINLVLVGQIQDGVVIVEWRGQIYWFYSLVIVEKR